MRREKVVRVIDGCTFLTASTREPIRLKNVKVLDNYSKKGRSAKNYLSKLIEGKTVEIKRSGATDVYGRAVAIVTCDKKSINAEMRRR